MGQRVLKDLMELRETRYELMYTIIQSVKHFCVIKPFAVAQIICFIEIHHSTTMGLNTDFMFQGEMGPEGTRGLPGEEGTKGTKVRGAV